jgi:methyltransferase
VVTSVVFYLVLLALIGGERVAELAISRRNAARAFARGGVETGVAHFRVMTLLHASWFVAIVAEVTLLDRAFPGALGWCALGIAAAAQALRWWAISTLGDRWNVRVIVVPGAPPVTGGPYRFLRHPNYLAVIAEIAAVPLIHGAWLTALLFSLGNAAILFVRIRAEETALGTSWVEAFADQPRLLPAVRGVGRAVPGKIAGKEST